MVALPRARVRPEKHMKLSRKIEIEKVDLARYFHPRINKVEGGCWLWVGPVAGGGYGRVYTNNGYYTAHRLSYVEHRGQIPDGLVVDHLCRVPACVNPSHLEPVTQGENVRRGLNPIARNPWFAHCPNGHPYGGDNLYSHRGHRHCRACRFALDLARLTKFRKAQIIDHEGRRRWVRVPRFVGALRNPKSLVASAVGSGQFGESHETV